MEKEKVTVKRLCDYWVGKLKFIGSPVRFLKTNWSSGYHRLFSKDKNDRAMLRLWPANIELQAPSHPMDLWLWRNWEKMISLSLFSVGYAIYHCAFRITLLTEFAMQPQCIKTNRFHITLGCPCPVRPRPRQRPNQVKTMTETTFTFSWEFSSGKCSRRFIIKSLITPN